MSLEPNSAKLQKATTSRMGEDTPQAHRMKSLKPNMSINVTYSDINIHQYVREMSDRPSEAVALDPECFPDDTLESLGKGPMNFLLVFDSAHYENTFLYLFKQTPGETFGATDNAERVRREIV